LASRRVVSYLGHPVIFIELGERFNRTIESVWRRAGSFGQHASLAFDRQGVAHIACYDEGNKNLLLATAQPGGGWPVEVVDAQGAVGRFASLAFDPVDTVDSEGHAHIAYYDTTNTDLRYAIAAAP